MQEEVEQQQRSVQQLEQRLAAHQRRLELLVQQQMRAQGGDSCRASIQE